MRNRPRRRKRSPQRLKKRRSHRRFTPADSCSSPRLGGARRHFSVSFDRCFLMQKEIAAIEVEREEDEGGLAGETFMDYRPSKLSIGQPHPDPIVETSSLSAVQPPEPTYNLRIKDDLESSKALSCLQIETLVYACQRHLQHLPSGARAGFFLGDGAGVGKGRTVAGLIWENWHHGRRKALWISVGSDLKFDARRDLDDVGATCVEVGSCDNSFVVHALNKLPYSKLDSKSVGIREGVVFLTYSSLIASSEKGRSRLNQLVQWCGQSDGLIVFDECHKAKILSLNQEGSRQRQAKPFLIFRATPLPGSSTLSYSPEFPIHMSISSISLCMPLLYDLWECSTGNNDWYAPHQQQVTPFLSGDRHWQPLLVPVTFGARLPEARVIYCSATGASEPRNMGYMVRLGLWGAGTSFADFSKFLGAMEKGGVGALELVAMDMKASLLSDVVPSGSVLTIDLFRGYVWKSSRILGELRVELLSASAFLPTRSLIQVKYGDCTGQIIRHMCMSAKVPAVIRLSKQALAENKCVVIGLQSTGEARTEEAVTKYGVELDDFISGPRELLLKFVEENYPLPDKPEPLPEESVKELQRKRQSATPDVSFAGRVRKVAKWDDESSEESEWQSEKEERKKLLQCSCCSQLVHPACLVPPVVEEISGDWSCHACKEKTEEYLRARQAYYEELLKRYEGALERKLKILEIIRSLDLPNNPLDDIIDQLGGPDKVAEITGRRGMLVRASGGKGVTYQARNTKDVTMEMVNMHEKQLFMDGKKLVAIISEAGSAGVSLQADRRAVNQKRRVHLTLELPWECRPSDSTVWKNSPIKSSFAPEYRLLFTNLGGERRFASIVAKRLESLGALTQGDRRAGPSLSAYNYDSVYGKRALMILYRGIMEQEPLPIVPPGCSSEKPESTQDFILKGKAALVSVGIIRDSVLGNGKEPGKISGRIVDSDMQDVGRFLNRLLGLPPEIQNRLFELFVGIFDLLIRNARVEGHLDSGIVDMKANTIKLQGTPKVAILLYALVVFRIYTVINIHIWQTVYVDSMSGASTVLFTFTLDRGMTWESASSLLEEKQKDESGSSNDGFYESRREWMGKRHFILAFEGLFARLLDFTFNTQEMALAELKDKYRKLSSSERAHNGWEDEYEAHQAGNADDCAHGEALKRLSSLGDLSGRLKREANSYETKEDVGKYKSDDGEESDGHTDNFSLCTLGNAKTLESRAKTCVLLTVCMHGPKCKLGNFCTTGRRLQEVNVLGGLILPVWGTIEKALSKQARQSHKRIRVVRIETTSDNQRIVGLLIPNAAVGSVLQGLNLSLDLSSR
ncbi:hypothetical protein DH2020_041704 [Rehmannia glutinosa]|uniref:Uncharacterized protein n=1 Tax=Rehmannia glutinosa TaxID=99300 RepID=A0ABR0URC5_REHGL